MNSGLEFMAMPWGTWLALSALGAALVLDDTAFAQTWLSQPLPAGVLAGLVCGDPLAGAAIGLPLQLVALANLPVGQGFVSEPASVVVAAVGAARMRGIDFGLADVVGVGPAAPLLGWLLVGAALAGLVGHGAVQAQRRAHFFWMLSGHRTLRDGNLRRIDRLQQRSLLVTAIRGSVQTGVWLAGLTWLWLPVAQHLPAGAARGLGWLPPATAGIAVGIMLERHRPRRAWLWLTTGAVAGFALTRLIGGAAWGGP